MPIDVRNDIDPTLTGALSFIAGNRKYRQRQSEQERAIQQRNQKQLLDLASQRDSELARERMLRERPDQTPTQRPYLSRNVGGNRRDSRAQLAGQAIAAEAQLAGNRDRVYGQLIERALAGQQAQHLATLNLQGDRQSRAAESLSAWGVDSAEALESQVKDIQVGLAKQQEKLTPEGRRLYGELTGKLRSVQKMRAEIRPADYSRLLGQWLGELNASRVQDFIEEPPTPEEIWNQRVMRIDDRNAFVVGPDGKPNILEIKAAESPEEHKFKIREQELKMEALERGNFTKELDAWSKMAPDPKHYPKLDASGVPGLVDSEAMREAWVAWQRMKPQQPAFWRSQPPVPPAAKPPVPFVPGGPGLLSARDQNEYDEPQESLRGDSLSVRAPAQESPRFSSTQEAAAALNGRQAPPQDRQELYRAMKLDTTAEGYPIFRTEEQAEAVYNNHLRPGEVFVDPEGKLRRKPGGTDSTAVQQQSVQVSTAQQSPVSVEQPEDLQQLIQSGELNVGDTVMTPRGPRVLTEEVSRKLMSATVDSAQQQVAPVQVQSQDELRAKIQSGEIPIGGKYMVNGVVFTRSR